MAPVRTSKIRMAAGRGQHANGNFQSGPDDHAFLHQSFHHVRGSSHVTNGRHPAMNQGGIQNPLGIDQTGGPVHGRQVFVMDAKHGDVAMAVHESRSRGE